MPRDPKFIRLADRLTNGIVADLNTGFSIAGLDVQEFPEEADQASYVRGQMHAGVIEAASAEEYKIIRGTDEPMRAATEDNPTPTSNWQENRIQQAAKETRRKLDSSRQADYNDPEWDPLRGRSLLDRDISYEEDQERREAVAQQVEEEGLDSTDPEEQIARAGTPARRASKKGSASRPGGETVTSETPANSGS